MRVEGAVELFSAFLTIGALFLTGLLADEIGRRTRAPRVTLLMLIGVGIGPSGFDLLPPALEAWYEFFAVAALAIVAFLLGGTLRPEMLRAHGREILVLSNTVALISAAFVTGGLWAIGAPAAVALLLGGIATATAPAAMQDLVRQAKATGSFPDRLLGIVAVDDGWGLILFSLILVVTGAMTGNGAPDILPVLAREIGGAAVIGLAIGVPAAFLTGRLKPGEPMLVEALGVVFLVAGFALWIEASFLVAGMVAGAVVANFARHHSRPFHEIENVEWPFLVLFFILGGAALELDRLAEAGLLVLVFVVMRALGRIVGGWIGGRLAGLDTRESLWTGAALMPQAGVAVGMALIAADHFPQWHEVILSVTLATTVIFELAGPPVSMLALRRMGYAR